MGYTGFGVSLVGIVGYRGIQLGTFDTITGINPYKKDKGIVGAVTTFAAAQTAITLGAGATYPFDTVRRRLQMQSEKPVEEHLYKGTMHCFKTIAAEEGLAKGLYKGFVANIVRSVGGASCWSSTTVLRLISRSKRLQLGMTYYVRLSATSKVHVWPFGVQFPYHADRVRSIFFRICMNP